MILKLFFLVSVVKALQGDDNPAKETLYFPEAGSDATKCEDLKKGIEREVNTDMGNEIEEGMDVEVDKCYKFTEQSMGMKKEYSVKFSCDPAAYYEAKAAFGFNLSLGTEIPYMVFSFYSEADCEGDVFNQTRATCVDGCCKYTSEDFTYFLFSNFNYPTCPIPVTAKEDPHMSNVNGERFDILREGVADLVNVPKETAKDLKIQAAFNRVQRACSSIYITEFNLNGLWLKRNIAIKTVNTGNANRPQDLSVMIDRQEMWPFWNITDTGLLITTRHGKKPHDEQGLYIKVRNLDIRMFQRVPKKGKGAWSYLNLDMKGLNRLASVGGILGTDDHSAWIRGPAECKHKISLDAQSSAFTPLDERGSWAFVA